ncbi:MAG: protocatechuate 3,4-dioxygenase [Alphaproteobacteria bacterium]|jgi:protocatechuate 3,4-dioxygenase beta subunit|nr:protocatechuate 3,4-dioxygenase [Alphaproteobacteria bacterium]
MLSRRRLIGGGMGLAAGLGHGVVAQAAALVATPHQGQEPFYPRVPPLDSDTDLVQVQGRPRRAYGQVLHVYGRLLDVAGRPLAGARVEIWQADALGRYHHPRERQEGGDPNFQGYGRMQVGADGSYRFRALKPVPYVGRAPHIHFRIDGAGVDGFTTQMYVEGSPRNHRDPLLARVTDARACRRLIVALRPAPEFETDALAANFDVVLGATPADR